MNPKIERQRQIVDSILIELAELRLINLELKETDPDFVTDFVFAIGQHRHTFEEQQVTDHKNCISFVGGGGKKEGVRGLLLMFANTIEGGREAILDVSKVLNKMS